MMVVFGCKLHMHPGTSLPLLQAPLATQGYATQAMLTTSTASDTQKEKDGQPPYKFRPRASFQALLKAIATA